AMLADGITPEEIADMLLDGLNPEPLDQSSPVYKCDCSRERTERVLISLGKKELDSIADDNKDISINCHFCGREYIFTPEEIRKLAEIQ
ncbi:MAG: Hsp33 family molecular chaperone HslO, partial [Ruminococcus sp.]|nr:Hsp33 family molecular chaperone HslO [Ruminococcus sp.]